MTWRVLTVSLLVAGLCAAPAAASYPGRNGKIAFTSSRNNPPNFEVYSMNPDGSSQTNLTNHPFEDFNGQWSADGERIAFVTERDNIERNLNEIYTMDADGSNQRNLTRTPTTAFENGPSWSPDGTQIVFERGIPRLAQEPMRDLYVINSAGFGESRLTHDGVSFQPAWSPDGRKIAFVSVRDGQAEIYVMNSDGSGHVRLTDDLRNDIEPDWSPDGSRIVFVRRTCCPANFNIFAMNSDGTGEVPLTSGPGDSTHPAWSPDGTSIAFASNRVDRNEIYVMRSDGSNPTNVSHDPGTASGPSWQPIPNRPPDCSGVRVTPQSLSPPNHKLVTATLGGGTDPDGDPVDLTVTTVSQDEPTGGTPDAVAGPSPNQVRLRSERNGDGDGRVYRIAFNVTDGHGGSCTGTVTVGVPKGHGLAVDSAPPSYDSL